MSRTSIFSIAIFYREARPTAAQTLLLLHDFPSASHMFGDLVPRLADRFHLRRFGAKPDKKIVDRSSGEPEFMEDAFHCNSDGLVVGVDRFWVVRPAC